MSVLVYWLQQIYHFDEGCWGWGRLCMCWSGMYMALGNFHLIFKTNCWNLFSAVLDLRCCAGVSLVGASRGYSLVVVPGLLTAVASLDERHSLYIAWASVVGVPGLQSTDSVVVVHGLSCSTACGIFPAHRWNPHLLHWWKDSLPLSHHGGPSLNFDMKLNPL